MIVALDQFGLSCARVESVSPDDRLNAARQVRNQIYKNALCGSAFILLVRNLLGRLRFEKLSTA